MNSPRNLYFRTQNSAGIADQTTIIVAAAAACIDTAPARWLTWIVVTRRRILIFAGVAIILFVVMIGRTSAPLSLSFSVTEMGLSQDRMPFTFITIKNEGTRAAKWGYNGCWLEIQTSAGSVTNTLSHGGIIEPGACNVFSVRLPPETQRWRVRCVASEASPRQRVSFFLRQRWDGTVRQLGRRFLSDKEGPRETICSRAFSYENFVEAPATTNSVSGIDIGAVTDLSL
jgi:hypothetical protein